MLNDTDDTWHHDTLLAIVSKNNKISGGFIREPQWECCTFAVVNLREKAYHWQREGQSLAERSQNSKNDTREPLTNLSTNTKTKHYGNDSN